MTPAEPDLIEEVSAHIEKTISPYAMVFHEIVSDDLHIDIHHVPPGPKRPFHALITSGMAALPMTTPEGADNARFAELAIVLAPTWNVRHEAFHDENVYWPVRLLKVLARFPFANGTWLGYGHTLADHDPPRPFAPATQLCAAVLLPPMSLGESFFTMERANGQTVHFWGVVPLYREELELKLASGADTLLGALDRAGVTDVVTQSRKNAARKPKLFGLF